MLPHSSPGHSPAQKEEAAALSLCCARGPEQPQPASPAISAVVSPPAARRGGRASPWSIPSR